MVKDKIDWNKASDFIYSHFLQIRKKTEEFLNQNPDWIGCCELASRPPRIYLCFWLKPEKWRKRGLKTFSLGDLGIKSSAAFISEEEMETIVVFVNSLIDGKNLKIKRVWPYEAHVLEYKIQTKDYDSFK